MKRSAARCKSRTASCFSASMPCAEPSAQSSTHDGRVGARGLDDRTTGRGGGSGATARGGANRGSPSHAQQASCKHRRTVTMTKGSFCAKIDAVVHRTPRCRMGSSPDLDCRSRAACQGATISRFLLCGAAHSRVMYHRAFPEASHPVGEHAAGACALPAASPGGPRSSAPT